MSDFELYMSEPSFARGARLVVVESPYASLGGDPSYLRECLRWCVERGYSPYASHGLLTQPGVLDDHATPERNVGMQLGFAWRTAAEATIVFTDFGISEGMRAGIAHAKSMGCPLYYVRCGCFVDGPDAPA